MACFVSRQVGQCSHHCWDIGSGDAAAQIPVAQHAHRDGRRHDLAIGQDRGAVEALEMNLCDLRSS